MKRFRVFAGPNGSGKSTVIKAIKLVTVNGIPLDFGVYVNADDIAVQLRLGKFSFSDFGLKNVDNEVFRQYAIESGLLRGHFTLKIFDASYQLEKNKIVLIDARYNEMLAQVLSNFLVKQLLTLGQKCSVETVFSHESKVDFMRYAASQGYKVYLYFVATRDPEINVERVKARVKKGGHAVPEDRIHDRYRKSLNLMHDAAQVAYQAYFFDNSGEENKHRQAAHFKVINGIKVWDEYDIDTLPGWFIEYYVNKQ